MAKKKVKFEEALKELDGIIESLESGELDLDASMEKYEKGRKALKQCYEILESAEKKIEMLTRGEDGGLKEQPFGAEND